MKAPKGYKVEKRDFDGDTGWVFGTPNGDWSDDCWKLRRYAVEAAQEHAKDPSKHEVVNNEGELV